MIWWIVGVVGAAVAGGLALLVFRAARRNAPIVSIVMIRSEARRLTDAHVRGAARRVLGADADAAPFDLPNAGGKGYGVTWRRKPVLLVIDAARPYCDQPAEEAGRMENPTARAAFAAHRAWVAVDLVREPLPAELRDRAQRLMGSLAAELLDEHVTLLYAPALTRVALPNPETESTLRGPTPMAIFGDDAANMPIINVEPDDARINRAIAEAQRRYPELVAVWSRRGRASKSLLKGRFAAAQGHEYMWIVADDIRPERASGELVNDPAHVPGLKKGDRVTIEAAEIVDWACTDGEDQKGPFVEQLLRSRA